jgi:hypothetical protein
MAYLTVFSSFSMHKEVTEDISMVRITDVFQKMDRNGDDTLDFNEFKVRILYHISTFISFLLIESVPPNHCGWLEEKRRPKLVKILIIILSQISLPVLYILQ